MTPFERHGITHLSASSLNLYRAEPALWVLRYLHHVKDDAGPGAWRGSAVEAGLDWAMYQGHERAKEKALERFELDAQGDLDEKVDKERKAIPDFLAQALEAFKDKGKPVARQYKIEHWLDGIEVPLIGYCDYLWPEDVVDLKTTWRMPSEPSADHCQQVAIYAKALKRTPHLVYVTPKKAQAFGPEHIDVDAALLDVTRAARAVRSLLHRCASASEAAEILVPNFDNFRWNDAMKAEALKVWQ